MASSDNEEVFFYLRQDLERLVQKNIEIDSFKIRQ
jgi:hypothetical protein